MNKRLLVFLALGGSLLASPPAWWSDPQTGILIPGATPAPLAPVTGSQLKNVAKKAALYLNNTLPAPGAGAKINAMVAGFQPSEGDSSPQSLAQLKTVAKPFYDRLRDVGFDTKLSLQSHGAPGWLYDYPWNPATPPEMNLSPAAISQLKWAFCFELSGFTVIDSDTDGLPNAWETAHGLNANSSDAGGDLDGDGLTNLQEYLSGTDPQDFWNGQPPVLTIVSGNQQGDLTGQPLAHPLQVKLANQAGYPKSGATVNFSIASGGGQLTPFNGGSTNSEGISSASLILPSAPPGTVVSVQASFAGVAATFTTTVGDPSLDPLAPGKPEIISDHSSTEALVQWEDRSDNETAFYVERTADGSNWVRVATLPSNTTSYNDTGLVPDLVYFYRVISHNNASP